MDIRKIYEDSHLISPGDALLVALSGGKDSVFMLHSLIECGADLGIKKIGAAHINHRLRGEESDGDEAFCRELCSSLKIPFYAERVNVKHLALLEKSSLEETGRRVRYSVLSRFASLYGYNKIATAHTLDDQAETIIFRLAKGCGWDGIKGIRDVRGNIIRPLLRVDAPSLLEWLKSRGIDFRRDQTNNVTTFDRNLIRHEVLPALERINPRYREAFLHFRTLTEESNALLSSFVEDMVRERFKADDSGYVLNIRGLSLMQAKAAVRAVIRDVFHFTLSFHDMGLLEEMLLRGKSGKRLTLSKDLTVHLNYQSLYFKPPEGFFSMDTFPLSRGMNDIPAYGISVYVEGVEAYPFQIGDNEYLIPEKECDKATLCARTRRRGDLFVPSGGKRKKIKKYLNDLKIPRVARDNLIMIADKNRIWAIVDVREGEGVNEPGQEPYIRIRVKGRDAT